MSNSESHTVQVLCFLWHYTAIFRILHHFRIPIFFFKLARGEDSFYLFIYLFVCLFTYFWLCWVFVSVRGLSPVAASRGYSSSWCTGLSLSRPLPLRSTGSRRAGSVIVAHRPSCSAACGILPERGTNPCTLHWQADSQPLRHQGSPRIPIFDMRNLFQNLNFT